MQAAGNGQSQDVQWDRGQLLEDRHRWQPRRWVPAHHAWLLPRSGVGIFMICFLMCHTRFITLAAWLAIQDDLPGGPD